MKMSLTITKPDGNLHNRVTWEFGDDLDTERKGELVDYMLNVRKHAKASGGAGDLKLVARAEIGGVVDHEETIMVSPEHLRSVNNVMINGQRKLLDNENARAARKGKP